MELYGFASICEINYASILVHPAFYSPFIVLFIFFWFFGTYRILKIPLLIIFSIIMSMELFFYCLVRFIVVALEFFGKGQNSETRSLRDHRDNANSYEEWKRVSLQLDQITGRDKWKTEDRSSKYDWKRVQRKVEDLQRTRDSGDVHCIIESLLPCMTKNFAGTMNLELYWRCHVGTKSLIEQYYHEVQLSLQWLKQSAARDENREEIFRFLEAAQLNYGNSALVLSGGAANGHYHIGLIRALFRQNLLPNVISGTSAGAIIGSAIASRTREETEQILEDLASGFAAALIDGPFKLSYYERFLNLFRTGFVYDHKHVFDHLSWWTGHSTFRQCFERSGRHFNVSASYDTHQGSLQQFIFNHIATPDVNLTHAVAASCCIPKLFPPVGIRRNRDEDKPTFVDGSIASDLPVEYVKELFGVNFAIVSQVNPHITPFFFNSRGETGSPSLSRPWSGGWRGGFLLALIELWLKEDLKKNCQLLYKFKLVPKIFGVNWVYVFIQRNEGDVTIVPKVRLSDYIHLVDNLDSVETLTDKVKHMETRAFEKLTYIEHRMRIENSLTDLKSILHGTAL